MTTKMFKIVDETGSTVITAETISAFARMERKTPRSIARREALALSNDTDGTFAVQEVADGGEQ